MLRASQIWQQAGFTLVEVMVVMGLMGMLFAVSSVNLGNLIPSSHTEATLELLVSDLRLQQLKAMAGDTEGRPTTDNYGIYFTPESYTLFHGAGYVATEAANFVVTLEEDMTFSTISLPHQSVIFLQASGEISNYEATQSSVVLENTITGAQVTVEFNRLGNITIIR